MSGLIQVPFGHTMVSRPAPLMQPGNYVTYGMAFPRSTHWRSATCEEFECEKYLYGWKTIVPSNSDHAALIRSEGFRRRYKYTESVDAGLSVFEFPAGQQCFKHDEHKVRLERDPVFTRMRGDFRYSYGVTVHKRAMDWVEDFSLQQDKLNQLIKRG